MAAVSQSAKRARLADGLHPALAVAQSMQINSPPLTDSAPKLKIGTHDGKFHCDEALACAMLSLLPAWSEAGVVRTRDPAVLATCDAVVDVGATYDAASNKFDHHQKGFDGTLDGFDTKLSSAGLVYKHYGKEVIGAITGGQLSAETVDVLYSRVYTNFIEHVDGIDNGVSVADGVLRYKVTTDLSSRVSRLHPSWNEDSSSAVVNEAFRQAVLLTGTELVEYIDGLQQGWLPARSLVQESLAAATDDGQVMTLTTFCPWQSHLFDLEKEQGIEGVLKYALYADSRGMWRIHAVAESEGSFATRKGLPEAWRGLRDAELASACGSEGASFVHAAGFIGGHATKEGALEMARLALE